MGCVQQMLLAEGAAGNTYATWNPSDKSSNVTLSNGNLKASQTQTGSVRSTISKTAGKWYWEVTLNSISFPSPMVGIANSDFSLAGFPGQTSFTTGTRGDDGIYFAGVKVGTIATFSTNGILGFALDAGGRSLDVYYNGVFQLTVTSGNLPTGALYAATGAGNSAVAVTANFGASAFTYSPPSGYNSGLYQ